MNSKTFAFTVTAILSASALFAEPRVDQSAVTLEQDSQSRLVTVGYELTGEPAVVTVDFQTNTLANAAGDWVSIGDVNFTNVIGDVNQVVQPGVRTITWQPDKSWPNQRINDGRVRAVVKAWATNAPPDWCVVCLLSDSAITTRQLADVTFNPARRRYFASKEAIPGGDKDSLYKTEYLLLRKIPAAGVVWKMGLGNYAWAGNYEGYAHKVMLTRDYYIAVYETTRKQQSLFAGTTVTSGQEDLPVSGASGNALRGNQSSYPFPDAQGNETHAIDGDSYLGKLRTLSGIDSFDLPTEAQWEYACRAGTGNPFYFSTANATTMKANMWYNDNAGGSSCHPVGSKTANAWGIYDMHGNVYEQCLDWWEAHNSTKFPDATAVTTNPIGPATGTAKVFRGGDVSRDWKSAASTSRPSNRVAAPSATSGNVSFGYRVVCDAVAK